MKRNDILQIPFKRDLWDALSPGADRADQLVEKDPGAALDAAAAAWRAREMQPFAFQALALRRQHALTTSEARRLVTYLLFIGRWDEALELVMDDQACGPEDAQRWCLIGQALAGVGRLGDAAEAAQRSLDLSPGFEPAEQLRKSIVAIVKLELGVATGPAWIDAGRLAAAFMERGAADRAATALERLFSARPPPDEAGEALTVAKVVLAACGGESAARLRPLIGALDLRESYSPLTPDAIKDAELCLGLADAAMDWLEAAIERLGSMTALHARDEVIRAILAREVGRLARRDSPVAFTPRMGPRKVFDLFPFNNELTMLRIKLAEMSDWVDHFVLVESRVTFSGQPKPLHYEQAKDQFADHASKIIHVVVDDMPACVNAAWAREFYQRDSAVRGLDGLCDPDDLVMVTDVDEIIDRRVLAELTGDFASLRMDLFRYFLNNRMAVERPEQRGLASIWKARYLNAFGPSYMRALLPHYSAQRIFDAGWHFQSIETATGIATKLRSYSHQEHAGQSVKRIRGALSWIRNSGVDDGWERLEIDDRFPAYVRENAESLAAFILPTEAPQ